MTIATRFWRTHSHIKWDKQKYKVRFFNTKFDLITYKMRGAASSRRAKMPELVSV